MPSMEQIKLNYQDKSFCICTFYNNGKANVMVIDSVITKEAYRGLGYGSKLINKAIMYAKGRGVDAVELIVDSDNKTAKRLYENAGFLKTDKDFYRLILNRFV
jgi:ribosomal protein S18 acetylase RimI-like enzyme